MSDNSKNNNSGKDSEKPMESVKTTSIPTKLEYAEDQNKKNAEKRKDK
jgi:hypothetical protein